MKMTYKERALRVTHPVTKKLLEYMESKKTNIGLAADLSSQEEIISLIHKVGEHICVLKTHIDIIENFDPSFTKRLQQLAEQFGFLLFEDRKFADIGHTVLQQYQGGMYRISEWADLVNAHILPGPGIVEGLKKVGIERERGLLLLAEMSSAGNFITPQYTQSAVELAMEHADFVVGFISQQQITEDPRFVHLTPGIQFQDTQDVLGQRYITPEIAIHMHRTDILLVGRGIYRSTTPKEDAIRYQQAGWNAYLSRITQRRCISL